MLLFAPLLIGGVQTFCMLPPPLLLRIARFGRICLALSHGFGLLRNSGGVSKRGALNVGCGGGEGA